VIDFDGQIELLAKTHNRSNFACGEPLLDDYLRRLARQHAASKISRTYVAVEGDRILGFYSLAMSAIRREQLPPPDQKRFPNYPVLVARLARLAVDQGQQGKGLGKLLLLDALYRCHRLSEEIGSVGVIVDAKNASAQSFYRKMDFEEFPETPLTLWLPATVITRLFGDK
jgi:GNAT superfamily N-acetyltransferase